MHEIKRIQNLHCKKCQSSFHHEENVAFFKQNQYHFHCFLCINCQKQLSHESFYHDEQFQFDISNPQIYCETCYLQRCPLCSHCHQNFTPTSIIIELQGKIYHNECFICSKCQLPLRNEIFYSKNKFFYCHQCMTQQEPCLLTLKSMQLLNEQCKICGKNFLSGEPISMYYEDYYHTDCFRCVNCQTLLINQGFYQNENGYLSCSNCHTDHGLHCRICKEPFLTGEILSQFDDRYFHQTCFLCNVCKQSIEMKRFQYENGKVVCEKCF
ncbi:hypothetical protein I4U23_018950 [Adineta vaga]|nr:hypothetical protein I4U23_018950 [Adineta vaga]